MSHSAIRPTPPLLVVLFAFCAGGCDLPQDQSYGDGGGGGSATAVGNGETTIWRLIQIADTSGADPSTMPGADLDAIVAFHDGDFVFAGCETATHLEWDELVYPTNSYDDIPGATLAVREQGAGGGFFSLAGGVLLCEFPVDLETGDTLLVAEAEGDGAESWEASLGEDSATWISLPEEVGSAELILP